MVGQGHRVWIARLAIVSLTVVVLGILMRGWWMVLTSARQEGAAVESEFSLNLNPSPSLSEDVSSTIDADRHPLDDVLKLARDALHQHQRLHQDYRAIVEKTERIGKKLHPTSKMLLKLRYEPLQEGRIGRNTSVYLKFIEPKSQAGREVIFCANKNEGMLKAHEGGLLGIVTVDLAPNSQLAMHGNRYPITEIGIEKLLTKLIDKGLRDRALGSCVVNRFSGEEIDSRPCELIEVIHPEKEVLVDGKPTEHEYHIARIWFDEELLLPLKYASYSWPTDPDGEPVLEEEYCYYQIDLNVGLSDLDFDISNKAYRFP